jgi:hypothetical protein
MHRCSSQARQTSDTPQAFEYFGAVPGRVRYDNLKPAVVRVLRGRDRAESERFIALRSHYGFDSFFCIPGTEGAHEKGGVEGEIGRFRRRHLVPVPAVASLAALNQLIAAADMVDDGRVITGRPVTVAAAFAEEQLAMGPLPAEPSGPARLLAARVDGRARVCVRQNYYSVPARYAGRRLPVRLSATAVEVLDGSRVVARHERAAGKYAEILVLDHYLEVLRYKPGALPGATALARARAAGTFTAAHQGYWDAARRQYGEAAGTRALIEVLLAHRTVPAAALEAAMTRATGGRRPGCPGRAHRRPPPGRQLREPGAVIADLHRRDRFATRIGDLHLMTVAVRVDPNDRVYCLCQHGHAASCLLPGLGRSRCRPGWSHRVAHL